MGMGSHNYSFITQNGNESADEKETIIFKDVLFLIIFYIKGLTPIMCLTLRESNLK